MLFRIREQNPKVRGGKFVRYRTQILTG